VETQPRKTAKETPAAGSLSTPASQGSSKKAKASNELMPGSDSYWTDILNRLVCTETKFESSYINQNHFKAMDLLVLSLFSSPLHHILVVKYFQKHVDIVRF
jgi:hypothetical protein